MHVHPVHPPWVRPSTQVLSKTTQRSLFLVFEYNNCLLTRHQYQAATQCSYITLKGTVSRDYLPLVFFMNQFPPSPRVSHQDRFEFFQKFAEIFASQGAPPVSTTPAAYLPPVSRTPAANFATSFASVVDTGGKFATSVNDTGGKYATGVNVTSGNLPQVSYNGNNIRLLRP